MSEELGEVIVDKETARASYVPLTYLLLFIIVFNCLLTYWS